MKKTIVQEYGPIYGEPVNGTVMGRPNGSVYVPISNTITCDIEEDYRYTFYVNGGTRLRFADEDFLVAGAVNTVARSQDLANNIRISVYSDAELTTVVAYRSFTAGLFNISPSDIFNAAAGLTDGQTLYVRAELLNNDVPVAISDAIEVTMVVPE